jgi:hypothetical protein
MSTYVNVYLCQIVWVYCFLYPDCWVNFINLFQVSEFFEDDDPAKDEGDRYNELVYKAVGASWDEVPGADEGLPPPLILHSQLR